MKTIPQIYLTLVEKDPSEKERTDLYIPENGQQVNEWFEKKTHDRLVRPFEDDKAFSQSNIILLNSVRSRNHYDKINLVLV
ncbi:hypothetical protein K7432_001987 [Basidiobolus ranarum]|uniref:Uncharacterized protein n=1 Tax=Basidiobolus ranarum TaxID=34480 RepID=A0ABR2W8J4_9FUNG